MRHQYITPLKWEYGEVKKPYDSIVASTPFGNYEVSMNEFGEIVWSYCFDEYHDEDWFVCESVEAGKQKAWDHWVERLTPCLVGAGVSDGTV